MDEGHEATIDGDGGEEGHGRGKQAHRFGAGKGGGLAEEFESDEAADQSDGGRDRDDSGNDILLNLAVVKEHSERDAGCDDWQDGGPPAAEKSEDAAVKKNEGTKDEGTPYKK